MLDSLNVDIDHAERIEKVERFADDLRFKSIHIKGGTHTSYAVTKDNRLYSWGQNYFYSMGFGLNNNEQIHGFHEVVIPNQDKAEIIDVLNKGEECHVLLDNGELYGWGRNSRGSIGVGNTAVVKIPTLIETNVDELLHSSDGQPAFGYSRTIIRKASDFYITGYNGYGQCALGDTSDRNQFTIIPRPNGVAINRIWYGGAQYGGGIICEDINGNMYGSGYNTHGQLGVGDNNNYTSWEPLHVNVSTNVRDVALQWSNNSSSLGVTHFLKNDGEIYSCGNDSGRGGVGLSGSSSTVTPTIISASITDVKEIAGSAGGGQHASFIATSDTLANRIHVWGYNGRGQLGNGSTADITSGPQTLIFFFDIEQVWNNGINIAAMYENATFLRTTDGSIYSSGTSLYGLNGHGETSPNVDSFEYITGTRELDIIDIQQAGFDYPYALFLTRDGRLYGTGTGLRGNVTGIINRTPSTNNVTLRRLA